MTDSQCVEFDPALAAYPTRTLRVDDLLHLTVRNVWRAGRSLHYRACMLRGDRFPPIAVVRLAGQWVVADGHKRLTAYRGFVKPTIVVEVWTRRRFLADQWAQLRKTVWPPIRDQR